MSYDTTPFMSYETPRPEIPSLHPPNCEIVTKMLNFGGWLIDVRTIAAKSVRLELQRFILAYVEAAGIAGDAKEKPLFRAGINGQAKQLTGQALTSVRICNLVKRRLKDAGLPSRLSPHSFRVNVANRVMWRSVMVVRRFPKFGATCAT
jgi:hypothetical protein